MTRINLLPWREAQRKERQRAFVSILLGMAILMVLVVVYVHLHFAGAIDFQRQRNGLLERELAELDRHIGAIQDLEQRKAQLLARMEVIQRLQSSRPRIVHLFDELVETLPEGVRLERLVHKDRELILEGQGQSNARVSAYMSNLEASQWLTNPQLNVIKGQDESGARVSRFNLKVQQRYKTPEQES